MPFPSDVLLPVNAKYHGFVDTKTGLNSHWDITWSFTFALTGTEHGFCTFLTATPDLSGGVPGHYLGYVGTTQYLTAENGEILLDEYGNRLIANGSASAYDTSGVLAIAFDSTGYFALSNIESPGVGLNSVKKNSLIVRDQNNVVICNQPLSSFDTTFFLASAVKSPQTLRFRVGSGGTKLHIDYKTDNLKYKSLTSLNITLNPLSHTILYPGLTFCSPISSSSILPSTLFLKNFHVQGNPNPATYETLSYTPLSAFVPNSFTSIPPLLV